MRFLLAMALAGSLLAGCATIPDPVCTNNVGDVGAYLADKLFQSGKESKELDMSKPIIVTSIANLDDLNETTAIGRLVGEQMGSRLTQLGASIYEPRLRKGLDVNPNGEIALSREAKDLAARTNATAFVTGTVTKMQGRYYFNARLVRVKDSRVIAAYDICLNGKVKGAGL